MVRVNVSEGLLEGELVQNEYGGTFYSFKGIPYAQPPLGNLRFKAPQPPKPWEGVRSAKQFGSKCYQNDLFTKTGIQGTEDCLYLNVYTPNIKPDKPLPVMFWIHGGGLFCGSGDDDLYGPEFLVKEDVILVTFNYRLEVLGFLCLDTEDVPGNAGMKDQVQALRWVNKNIANFGGDPNNITIFGESAGGLSVSYHTISPMSKGLFKRAIAQSGVTTSPWARATKPRERALALARQLGCYSENNKELYEFFQNQPMESLIIVLVPILLSEKAKGFDIYFGVVEEKQFGNNERFFNGDLNSVHENIEIIVGYTADEGVVSSGTIDNVKTNLLIVRDFPEFFVSKLFAYHLTPDKQLEMGKKIKKFYFNDKIDLTGQWETLASFHAADMCIYPVVKFSKLYSKNNKVFLYRFSCKTERNVICDIMGIKDLIGNKQVTCHADDLLYLFNARLIPTKVNLKSNTFQVMTRVIKLWTNFAKHGDPTPDNSLGAKWKQYSVEGQDFLDIGNELVPGTAPNDDDVQFWENIYQEYGPKS